METSELFMTPVGHVELLKERKKSLMAHVRPYDNLYASGF